MWRISLLVSLLGLNLFGCTVLPTGTAEPRVTSVQTTPPPTPVAQASPTPTQRAIPAHRIGVRVVNGVGEFYDRITGQKFVPRGNNYIRLGPQTHPSGTRVIYHSTFDPGSYDASRVEATLQHMRADGYNVVRVFFSQNTIGDPSGGLSSVYLKNVVDFLNRAKANGIYVMPTQDWIPGGQYGEILNQDCCVLFNSNNVNYLSPAGLRANRAFFQDLIRDLYALGAPLDAIFAFELRNELFYEANIPPLSLTSGVVTAANGKVYNMSSQDDKRRMMDETLVYWIDNLRAAILEVDPTALVTVGFFWPQEPHPARIGDPRFIETRPAIWQSNADFIDLHPYPGEGLSMREYADNFKIDGMQAKPLLMGEFGAARSAFSSVAAAAKALHDWQVESCQFGFDGWLLWTWDTDEQRDFFNGLGDGGLINQALAPANRPDPCKPSSFDFFENNLALGKPARASRSLPDYAPSKAVDGTFATWWGAGAPPPQWIEIDLGTPVTIRLIRLITSQSPEGETTHQILGGGTSEKLNALHEFRGRTADNQTLEFKPASPITGIRYVRVMTTQSPSWVAWREIEVIGR